MSQLFKFKKNEKGQTIVEFAIILPILLIVVMGIIQFGLIFLGFATISNAAREGARVGIVQPTYDDAKSAAIIKVNEAFDATPTVTKDGDPVFSSLVDFRRGNSFRVTVSGKVDIIVPLLGSVFPSGEVSISRTSTMRIE